MIIRSRITTTFHDNDLDKKIKEYGAGKMAKKLNISPSYLSMCLSGKEEMSARIYYLILAELIVSN